MGEVYEKALKRRDLSGVIASKEEDAATAMYRKSKQEEKAAKEEAKKSPPAGVSTGKVLSLMSTDTNKCVAPRSPAPRPPANLPSLRQDRQPVCFAAPCSGGS